MDDLDLTNYENYVKHVVQASGYRMGGTHYAPVLSAIIEGVPKKGIFSRGLPPLVDHDVPSFILFITDGENADQEATDQIIKKSSEMNVFIKFIGIAGEVARFLQGGTAAACQEVLKEEQPIFG